MTRDHALYLTYLAHRCARLLLSCCRCRGHGRGRRRLRRRGRRGRGGGGGGRRGRGRGRGRGRRCCCCCCCCCKNVITIYYNDNNNYYLFLLSSSLLFCPCEGYHTCLLFVRPACRLVCLVSICLIQVTIRRIRLKRQHVQPTSSHARVDQDISWPPVLSRHVRNQRDGGCSSCWCACNRQAGWTRGALVCSIITVLGLVPNMLQWEVGPCSLC